MARKPVDSFVSLDFANKSISFTICMPFETVSDGKWMLGYLNLFGSGAMVEKKTLSFSIGAILVLTTVVSVACSNIALYFSLASKQTKPVVVAKRELASGRRLTRQDVEIKQFLVEQVPEGVFSNPDEILGMTTTGRLPQGQLIHQSNISSGFSTPSTFPFRVAAVKIDDASGRKLDTVKVGELVSLSTCEMTIIGSTQVFSIDVPSSRLVVSVDDPQSDLILEFEPITGGFQNTEAQTTRTKHQSSCERVRRMAMCVFPFEIGEQESRHDIKTEFSSDSIKSINVSRGNMVAVGWA